MKWFSEKKLKSDDDNDLLDAYLSIHKRVDEEVKIMPDTDDPYSIGYACGKAGESMDIERADDDEYYLGYLDGLGDRDREEAEVEDRKRSGNPAGDPYIDEIHKSVDEIMERRKRYWDDDDEIRDLYHP